MGGSREASLRELLARLIDSSKAFVQAELALVRKTMAAWAGAIKIGAALITLAIVLVNAAVIVLIAALGMALAGWLGMVGGLAAAGAIALLSAGVLIWLAIRCFKQVTR